MVIQKISVPRRSLGDVAYQHLFRGFLNNELLPGTRLLMDELAEQMDISRTPVREALQRFEREGLIKPHGRRGYVVREVTAEELDGRYEAREAIEGFAVDKITATGGDAVKRLRKDYEGVLDQPQTTPEEVFLANRNFHRVLVANIDNMLLLEAFDLIWNCSLTSGIWARMVKSEDVVGDFQREHQNVVEAIESGNVEHAHNVVIEHINRGRTLHEY